MIVHEIPICTLCRCTVGDSETNWRGNDLYCDDCANIIDGEAVGEPLDLFIDEAFGIGTYKFGASRALEGM